MGTAYFVDMWLYHCLAVPREYWSSLLNKQLVHLQYAHVHILYICVKSFLVLLYYKVAPCYLYK